MYRERIKMHKFETQKICNHQYGNSNFKGCHSLKNRFKLYDDIFRMILSFWSWEPDSDFMAIFQTW